MIDSGVKVEEYREIKEFWLVRLTNYSKKESNFPAVSFLNFLYVEFQHGYSKTARRMTFEMKSISIATGNPDWGAESGKKYFVIKLGKRL